jgi:hypothetical protein
MAIKLDVYLTRTQQSLEKWLYDNDITSAADLAPKCSYFGLACSTVDIALADKILKAKKEQHVVVQQEVQEIKQEAQEEKQKSSKKKDVLKTQNK